MSTVALGVGDVLRWWVGCGWGVWWM